MGHRSPAGSWLRGRSPLTVEPCSRDAVQAIVSAVEDVEAAGMRATGMTEDRAAAEEIARRAKVTWLAGAAPSPAVFSSSARSCLSSNALTQAHRRRDTRPSSRTSHPVSRAKDKYSKRIDNGWPSCPLAASHPYPQVTQVARPLAHTLVTAAKGTGQAAGFTAVRTAEVPPEHAVLMVVARQGADVRRRRAHPVLGRTWGARGGGGCGSCRGVSPGQMAYHQKNVIGLRVRF